MPEQWEKFIGPPPVSLQSRTVDTNSVRRKPMLVPTEPLHRIADVVSKLAY